MANPIRTHRLLLLVPLLMAAPACTAAAGAAAGAAAAVAYNERNASSEVAAPVPEVVASTEAVFQEMGIAVTGRTAGETEAEIRGDDDGVLIIVNIERESERTSEVVVTAREGDLNYHPQHAGEILRRILDRTG